MNNPTMTMPAMKANSVRLRLHDFLKDVVNKLLNSYDLPAAQETYDFLKNYSSSNVGLVGEFCRSLQIDLPRIDDRIKTLTGFQHEQFTKLLDVKYRRALQFLDPSSAEETEEFYLDLTFHIIRDLDNYIEQRDKPKEPLGSVIDLNEAVHTASFFYMPFHFE